MKLKVEANELHDADVTHVSLVKNGAIRAPFKILKTEDIPEPHESMVDKAAKFFGKEEAKSKVTAVIVNGPVEGFVKAIEGAGFSVSDSEDMGNGLTIFKQEGYDPNAGGSAIALNENVLCAVDCIRKEFMPFNNSTDFTENLQSSSFLPSFGDAMRSLESTLYNTLESSGSTADVVEKMSKALTSFKAHVVGLTKNLPQSVFKLDASLSGALEGFTVSKTESNEDTPMERIREAAPGDHDGLNDPVVKAEADPVEAAPVEKEEATAEEPKAAVSEPTAEAEVAKEEATPSEDVAKTEEEPKAEAPTEDDPLKIMASAISTMTNAITGLTDRLAKQDEKIEALAKGTQEALEKAENTTPVVDWSMDQSLATPNRSSSHLQKHDEGKDVFDNLFTKMR